jgi:hypothetical protein
MPNPWERPLETSREDEAPAEQTSETPPWVRPQNPYASPEELAPSAAKKTRQDLRGHVAAGMRGALEAIPGGTDLGAAVKEYFGNPLTGEKASGDFTRSKRDIEAKNALYAKEHPKSYFGGQVAGTIGSLLVPEAAGANIIGRGLQVERALAKPISKVLGSAVEGELVAKGLMGAGTGAAQGAIHGLGTGVGEERLTNAMHEGRVGAILGAPGAFAGSAISGVGRKVGESLGFLSKPMAAPTAAEIKNVAQQGYDAVENAGLQINTKGLNKLFSDANRALNKANFNPRLVPEHSAILPHLNNINPAHPGNPSSLSLTDLHLIREEVDRIAYDFNNPPSLRRVAGGYRKSIDNFIENLNPTQASVAPGHSINNVINTVKRADATWKQFKKLNQINKAYTRSFNNAANARGNKDVSTMYRTQLKNILNDIETGNDFRWNKDEIESLRQVVHGGLGERTAELASRFSPFERTVLSATPIAGAFANPWALALSGAGLAGDFAKRKLIKDSAKRFGDIVAAGKPAVESGRFRVSPTKSLAARTYGVPLGTFKGIEPRAPSPVYAEDVAPSEDYEQFENPRNGRAAGGRLGNRDYPAKRLTRVERAAKRAMDAIAHETKPLMEQPDQVIADALKLASGK